MLDQDDKFPFDQVTEPTASPSDEEDVLMLFLDDYIRRHPADQNDMSRPAAPTPQPSVSSVSSSVDSEPEWPEVRHLPENHGSVPTMAPDMLPVPVRQLLTSQARIACLPLEMFAAPTIAMISGVVGRTILVRPDPRNAGWQVVPNLWAMIVAPPGMLKTPVLQSALTPLRILESEEAERHSNELPIITGKLKYVEARLMKASLGQETSEEGFKKLILDKQRLERQLQPRRYLIGMVTTQKVSRILAVNERGLVMPCDELAPWLRTLDQSTNAEKRGLFLSAWSGDNPFTIDTVSGGTIRIEHPCLTVIGAIQPGPLKDHLRRNGAGTRGDQGLIQRFQLAVYPDQLGEWKRNDDAVQESDLLRMMEYVRRIDGWWSSQNSTPKVIGFSEDAQKEWYEWHDEIERRVRSTERQSTAAVDALLSKYRSLVPSLAAVFTVLNQVAGNKAGTAPDVIDLPELELAIRWAGFLEAHGRKILGDSTNPADRSLRNLAAKILSQEVADRLTVRELMRKQWSGLSEKHQVTSALESLTRLGWLKVERVETGGRESKIIRLNPRLFETLDGSEMPEQPY